MSANAARIDDPVPDSPAHNAEAVHVEQEIERLTAEAANEQRQLYGDESDQDDYLEQYELDSDEEDELLLLQLEADGLEDVGNLNIEDEDWEVADGDFTKLYNRMRQHQRVLSSVPTALNGKPQGVCGEADIEADMPLPARNIRRGATSTNASHRSEDNSLPEKYKNLTARQLRAVERRLGASIGDTESDKTQSTAKQTTTSSQKASARGSGYSTSAPLGGVPSAPKHSSLSANQKDKADRATVDQVLDSRTRAVLQSLIRRGLVAGVEGCVSTGKEANVYYAPGPVDPPEEIGEGKTYPKPYPSALALKIFKTSILGFKSRSQYIQGEHRFRNAYTKVANPRKMVKVWAEKELRNLRRLFEGGVRCPRVVDVRENVLVMEFLGLQDPSSLSDGAGLRGATSSKRTNLTKAEGGIGQDDAESSRASKRLKDADVDVDELRELYAELLVAMRWMFRRCKLVHTDLSEYNILYHNSHLYIIDVSQSVEHDHPSSFDFLRHDIKTIDEFFIKRSGGEIRTLGIRGTFDFVVNDTLAPRDATTTDQDQTQSDLEDDGETEEQLKEIVREWLENGVGLKEESSSSSRTRDGDAAIEEGSQGKSNLTKVDQEAEEAVFMSSYIPRNLGEVYDPERDIDVIASGKGQDLIYARLTGLDMSSGKNRDGASTPSSLKSVLKKGPDEVIGEQGGTGDKKSVKWQDEEDSSEAETNDEDNDQEEEEEERRKPRGFRHEDKESKKERKKAVKEEKREKRQTKMPKAEKQKKIKQSAHGGK